MMYCLCNSSNSASGSTYVLACLDHNKVLVFFFFLDAVSVFLQVFPPERNKSEGLSVK